MEKTGELLNGQSVKYDAFISYRHLEFDKQVAVRLQKMLEGYVPPKSVMPKKNFKHFRIFRDETELSTSNSLSDAIREGLRNSRYLIVICSPGTAASRWCMEEITYFKELHNGSTANIRVIVIEGEPEKIMPAELLFEEPMEIDEAGNEISVRKSVEPLALNIIASTRAKSMKMLKTEYLRIAATLLGLGFEDLYQRNQKRAMRRGIAVSLSAGVFLVGIIVYGSILLVYANRQRVAAQENYELAQENYEIAEEQRAVAEDNLSRAQSLLAQSVLDYALRLNDEGARTRSTAILHAAYGAADPEWENYDKLQILFRDAALSSMFFKKNDVYASLDLSDTLLDISLNEDDSLAVATARNTVTVIDTATGIIVYEANAVEGDFFTSACIKDGFLFCGTEKGSLIRDNMKGDIKAFESVCTSAIEKLYWQEESGALVLVNASYRTSEYIEEIHLSMLVLADDEPQLDSMQTFTLLSDLRGDISCRYSMSANGRYLAVKNNISINTNDDGAINFEIVNRDIIVLDTGSFNGGKSKDENYNTMAHIVDYSSDSEDFAAVRYSIDNKGVLFLDLQTKLYYGNKTNGYLSTSTREGGDEQVIAVYDVPSGVLLFNSSMPEEEGDDIYYSSFVTVDDARGYLPFVRYNKDGTSEFTAWELTEELLPREDLEVYRYKLPDNYYGDYKAITIDSQYGTPAYLFTVNFGLDSSSIMYLYKYSEAELAMEKGEFTALATSKSGNFYINGLKSGTVKFYTTVPSQDIGGDELWLESWNVMKGSEKTGVALEYSDKAVIRLISYNDEGSKVFGHARAMDKEEADLISGYYIWDIESGKTERKLEFIESDASARKYAISGDFSFIVEQQIYGYPEFRAVYTVLDVESGEELFEYLTVEQFDYFGIGRSRDELWFVSTRTGTIDTINISSKTVVKQERIKNQKVRSISAKIYYNPDRDYVVIDDCIYSFSSEKTVFNFKGIVWVNSDCTALHTRNGGSISLLPDDLYDFMHKLPVIPVILPGDAAATGIESLLPAR